MTLKDALGDELFAQVEAKLNEINAGQTDRTKHVRFADLSEGGYISRSKHDDKVGALTQQVADLQRQIAQRDTDLAGLNERLTAAKADAGQYAEVQNQLSALQAKYDADSKEWEARNARQAYEFAVRTKAGELKFTSAAARKDFIREAIAQGFKQDGDTLMGYTEFLTRYRESDPGAFVSDQPKEDPTPKIVIPGKSTHAPKKMSLSEMMKAKNADPNTEISFEG